MMAGRLTTHVLDTTLGRPAAGVGIFLRRLDGDAAFLCKFVTNDDGRSDRPLIEGAAFTVGRYELVFHVGAYMARCHVGLPEPAFLDEIAVRFGVSDAEVHYHVPLLVSPYGYGTYRGS